MPVSYSGGTLLEHHACRTGAALFDVSHLGTVRVTGSGAFDALQQAFTNDLSRIGPGRAQYTHLLDPDDGSVLDDLIVWWVSDDRFDVMPNASNTSGVRAALGTAGSRPEGVGRPSEHQSAAAAHSPSVMAEGVTVEDVTSTRAVLALQGPTAREVLRSVSPEAAEVPRFRVGRASVAGVEVVVAGTGYTGEDGVELAVPAHEAVAVWRALTAAGAQPAGLGARDTLRLEAGLPLHGHELGPGITSDDAGLSWVVRPDKGEFQGRDALLASRLVGGRARLHGIVTAGRQPPRDGSVVLDNRGSVLGRVSSGNFSPQLGHGIALAFLATPPGALVEPGTVVSVDVRGRLLAGAVSATPFVRRGNARA